MKETLFGLETEYAFTPLDCDGGVPDRAPYFEKLLVLAARHFPSLYGCHEYDLFLANGARLYLDSGIGLINLEYSTPECTRPGDLIAHVRAGDSIVARLAHLLEQEHPEIEHAFVSKTNFDYCGHTSGSHENYLHLAPQAFVAPRILPHLATRLIYSGGGGWNDVSPGMEFMLSPRVRFLEHVVSSGAQHSRGIFCTRQENLSDTTYGRAHLLCGEGVRFDLSEYLRIGTTALILKLIDSGKNLSGNVEIDPLIAMNIITRDTSCRKVIGRLNGRPATAVQIQRHLMTQVSDFANGPLLPDWAAELCTRWQSTLDSLENNPMDLAGKLDWPTKLALYRHYARSRGCDLDHVTRAATDQEKTLRCALFELDVRFGDISAKGLFSGMTAVARNHGRITADSDIEKAVRAPPQGTRAQRRGALIARLSDRRASKQCNWHEILDCDSNQSWRFQNPYA